MLRGARGEDERRAASERARETEHERVRQEAVRRTGTREAVVVVVVSAAMQVWWWW